MIMMSQRALSKLNDLVALYIFRSFVLSFRLLSPYYVAYFDICRLDRGFLSLMLSLKLYAVESFRDLKAALFESNLMNEFSSTICS